MPPLLGVPVTAPVVVFKVSPPTLLKLVFEVASIS
jgi:hypothetical protein